MTFAAYIILCLFAVALFLVGFAGGNLGDGDE